MNARHEQEQPRAGWLVRLENILGSARGLKIEGKKSSIIIGRTKDRYADFQVQVSYRANPEIKDPEIKKEYYELRKEIGLVYIRITFASPQISNIVGFNFPEHLGLTEDIDITSGDFEDDPAAQLEFNMGANILMDYVEKTAKNARVVVKDPRPVE